MSAFCSDKDQAGVVKDVLLKYKENKGAIRIGNMLCHQMSEWYFFDNSFFFVKIE